MNYLLIPSIKGLGKRKGRTIHSRLYSPLMPVSPVEGDDLFITSGVLKPFVWPIREAGVQSLFKNDFADGFTDERLCLALRQATESLTAQNHVCESPLPLSSPAEGRVTQEDVRLMWYEIYALAFAIAFWLNPKGRRNIPPFTIDVPNHLGDPLDLKLLASYCLAARTKQVITTPQITKEGTLTHTYQSEGLIPLAWMETWYALEHSIKAKICPYCAEIFVPSPFHPNMRHCQSAKCRQERRIEQKGGIEKYREWERTRKREAKSPPQ